MSTKRRTQVAIAVGLIVGLVASGHAVAEHQNDAIGFSSQHVFSGALDGENIDVLSGNVNLRIPIGPRYSLNDWFGYQVVLYYNSKIWENECQPGSATECPGELVGSDTYGQGFQIHFGRIWHHPKEKATVYRYQTPDGADHFFCTDISDPDCGANGLFYTVDSSPIAIRQVGSTWEAYPGDGTVVRLDHCLTTDVPAVRTRENGEGCYATRIETIATKPSGNPPPPQQYVNIVYGAQDSILEINDSAPRTITFGGVTGGIEITFPAVDGSTTTTAKYTLLLSQRVIRDPWIRLGTPTPGDSTRTRWMLTNVTIPALAASEKYTFSYTPQSTETDFGFLSQWTVPTGATTKYWYTQYKTSQRKPWNSTMTLRELTANGQTYRWSYKRFGDGACVTSACVIASMLGSNPIAKTNPDRVEVLNPFDNLAVYQFIATPFIEPYDCENDQCGSRWVDGLLEKVETFAGPAASGDRLVQRTTYRYTHDGEIHSRQPVTQSTAFTIGRNVRVEEVETVTPGHGVQLASVHRVVYGRPEGVPDDGWTPASGFIRRPRITREYDGAELYRQTLQEWYPTPQFHDNLWVTSLQDASGRTLERTHTVFSGNRRACEISRRDATVDPLNGVLPAPCPSVPGDLPPGSGDVATVHSYDSVTGSRTATAELGGDDESWFTTTFEHENGVLSDKKYAPFTWSALHRTIDSDTGLVMSSRDPNLLVTAYTWDSLGRLLSVDPPGSVEASVTVQYTNVKETHVRQTVGTETTESVFFYDDLGRVIEEQRTNAIGGKDFRKTEWDLAGRMTQQSEWAERPFGASPGVTDVPASELAWTIYDYGTYANPNAGLPGEPDRFTDPLGRIAKVTRPDSSVTETRYDGLATTVIVRGIHGLTENLDSATTYFNDVFGRLVAVDSPESVDGPLPGDGADAVYLYDERDDLVQVELTDPADTTRVQLRYFEYDALGNLRFATNPENGTVSYLSYDAGGRLLHHRDTASREFINTYDEAGRLVLQQGKICPMPSCPSNPALTLLANTYDVGNAGFDSGAAAGKLTQQKSYRDDSGQSALVSTRDYRYGTGDGACPMVGMPTGVHLGLNGRLEQTTTRIQPWDRALETRYCYNARGLPAAVLYPDAADPNRTAAQITWSYTNGQLVSVRDAARVIDHAFAIQYDPHGAVTFLERASGVRTEILRDVQGRPLVFDVRRVASGSGGGGGGVIPQECEGEEECEGGGGEGGGGGGGGPVFDWQYGPYVYDGAGNISSIGLDTFAYDELNRLVASSILNDGVTFGDSWTYDAFGNMVDTERSVVGSSAYPSQTSHAFVLDWQRNQLRSQGSVLYDHDPAGNLIRDDENWNVFDERNRLVEVWDESTGGPQARVAQYDYDTSGYRVRSLVQGIETYFLRNEAGQVLSEFRRAEGGTEQAGWDKDYVYGLGQALAVVKNEAPGPIGQLRVVNKTSYSVTLAWGPSDDTDFKWYCVERQTMPDSGGYQFHCQISGTTWQDNYGGSLPAGTTGLYYLVRAVDWADNEGPWSAELVFHPNDTTAPPVPVLLAAEGLDRAVRVRWEEITGVDDLAGFIVERSIGPNNYQSITPTLVQGSEFLDVGLTNGTFYRYRVRSVDTSNNPSAPSNWKPATADDGLPPAPHGLVARPGFVPGTIELSWTPISGATSYDTVRRVCPDGDGYATPDADDTDTEATDVNVPVGQDWCYYVQSCDGLCVYPAPVYGPVVARARSFVSGAPTAIQADFEVQCPAGETAPCPGDLALNSPNVSHELLKTIGVAVSWTALGDPAIVGYRIYRAPGTTTEFARVADVAEDAQQPVQTFFDTGIGDWKYTYQVVAVLTDGNEAVGCASGCAGAVAEDEYPSDAVVRNVVAYDSSDESSAENAASRGIKIEWSRVVETQLLGYHVYRRCAWDLCDAIDPVATWSADTLDCGDSWVRLTDVPVTASEYFEDRTTRGLGGCYLYAVQPVGPGGLLGDFRKILSVSTTAGDNVTKYTQPQDEFPDSSPGHLPNPDHDDEIARLNAATRGTGSPGGPTDPPETPTFPSAANTGTKFYPWVTGVNSYFPADSVSLEFGFAQNSESDLKGYHVEMAGSINGPWARVTTHPIAWWETEYSLRGLGACKGPDGSSCSVDTSFYGSHDCAHVRLIAVDEDGNESPAGYPVYFLPAPPYSSTSRSGCSLLPTPGAPQDLVAVGIPQGGGACNVELTWSQVSEAMVAPAEYEYAVYRLTFATQTLGQSARYFYRTQVVEATSCVAGVCSYLEQGGSGDHVADPNVDCPYRLATACENQGTQAFYVTVRRKAVGSEPHGGESPRSQVVIWDCTLGDVSRAEPIEDDAVYFANAGPSKEEGDVPQPPAELAVCETEAENESVILAQIRQRLESEPALAPLLFLGQVPPPLESPGYRVIDLHVDHLGSVRLTTDELGQVTAQHDFLPFGEEIFPIVPSPDGNTKMFTGHERDSETGSDYMLARSYRASALRFDSVDPIGPIAIQHSDAGSFQTLLTRTPVWNKYSYVMNRPLYYVDPTGRSAAAAMRYGGAALIVGGALDPLPIEEFIGYAMLGMAAGMAMANQDIFDNAMSQLNAAEADLMGPGHGGMDPRDGNWWNVAKRFLDKINEAIRLKGKLKNKKLARILEERIADLLARFHGKLSLSPHGPCPDNRCGTDPHQPTRPQDIKP